MATVDLGAGASGWSAERRARVRALIGALVERLTGLGGAPERGGVADADAEENRATAVAFVEGNLRHHTFLDVNPSQLGRKYGALEERFRRRAQLRKAEALRALAGRLSRTPSPEQEPEANYAVLSALLALANEPLKSEDAYPPEGWDTTAAQRWEADPGRQGGANAFGEFDGPLGATLGDGPRAAVDVDVDDDAGSMGSWHYSELSGEEDLSDWSEDEPQSEEVERWRRRREEEIASAAAEARARQEAQQTEGQVGNERGDGRAAACDLGGRLLGATVDDDSEAGTPQRERRRQPQTVLEATLAQSDPGLSTEPTHTELELVRQIVAMVRYGAVGGAFLLADAGADVGNMAKTRFVLAPMVQVSHLSRTALRSAVEPLLDIATALLKLRRVSSACAAPARGGARAIPTAAAMGGALRRALDAALAPTEGIEVTAMCSAEDGGTDLCSCTLAWLSTSMADAGLPSAVCALEAAVSAAHLYELCGMSKVRGSVRADAVEVARSLSGLYAQAEREWAAGQPPDEAYAMPMLIDALHPYAESLSAWLHEGNTEPGETQAAFVRDAGAVEKSRFWADRYSIDEELCPSFLRQSAAAILEAGKSLRLLRDAGPKLDEVGWACGAGGDSPRAEAGASSPRSTLVYSAATSAAETDEIVALAEAVTERPASLSDRMRGGTEDLVAGSLAARERAAGDASLLELGLDPSTLCGVACDPADGAAEGEDARAGARVPAAPASASAPRSATQLGLDILRGDALLASDATRAPWQSSEVPSGAASGGSYGVGAHAGVAASSSAAAALALSAGVAKSLEVPEPSERVESMAASGAVRAALVASPPSAVLAASLLDPVTERCEEIAAKVCAVARTVWKLPETLASLRAVYLCAAGDAIHAFASTELFDRIAKPAAIDDESALSASLSAALADSCHAEARDAADAVHVRVLGAGGARTRGAPAIARDGGLDAISSLRVDFDVAWPANIVVDAAALSQYNAVLRLMLQLKHAHSSLAAVPICAGEAAAEEDAAAAAAGRRVAVLRAKLLNFVSALRSHVMHRSLDGCWHMLQSAMAAATSLEEMCAAHRAYLHALSRQCMIAPDKFWSLVSERVQSALSAVLAFTAAAGTLSDGYCSAAEVRRAMAAVEKAERAFDESVRFLIQVLNAKLKVGTFPALAELRGSLDFNGFHGSRIG